MRKFAKGEIDTYSLLLGVRYGSAGATMQLLAVIVGGGKLYVFQTFGLDNAAASEARRVVMAAVIVLPDHA